MPGPGRAGPRRSGTTVEPGAVAPAEWLHDLALKVLAALEVPPGKARLVAESLVTANLRGVDSHGVMLLPYYVEQLKSGNVDANADGRVVSESGACLVFDGEHGLGQHVAHVCCGHAVRLAREHGLGMVVARNSSHFGAAALWAQRMSRAGMAGLVMSNASPSVPPWQGREGRIGTNPGCLSVPSAGEGAWLLDMATTTVAKNRIVKAVSSGQSKIPPGWAMDSEGVPTTVAAEAVKGLLMPLGGYKGSGLGMMAEILSAVLSGGSMSTDVGGLYVKNRRMNTSHSFLAIDVACFLPVEEFQSRMEKLVGNVKSALPAQGYGEVLVAGDPERRAEASRRREGVPLDAGVWRSLRNLAGELHIALGPPEFTSRPPRSEAPRARRKTET